MSEEEKFKTIIQEIKDIYLLLTEQEPTPDDEIEAREKLIEKIKILRSMNTFDVGANMHLFDDTIKKLEEWDTLELWFIESELPEDIQKIINITDKSVKFEKKELNAISNTQSNTQLSIPSEKNSISSQIDITEIVDKVSEQFKGEIEGLKDKIETLKQELEKKDETLKQVSQQKVVKMITPKKESKLPPPTIKIPTIKAPKEVPKVQIKSKPIEEQLKDKIEIKVTEIEQPKREEEKLKETKPKITIGVTEKPSLESQPIESNNMELSDFLKPEITIEEVETEYVKSSGEDLFNVFSSVGDKNSDNSEQVIGRLGGMLVKEKKKKEEKKKKDIHEKTSTMPFVEFSATKSEEIIPETEELPTDKDALYQELIALEGRRYSLEKSFKDLEKRYHKGNIDDFEYKKQSDDLKFKLNEITSRINKIRRVIAGL
ncbi:MAG: hypothetical protein ACFE9T_04120 [Promethearchaeota archaeon]